MCVSTLENKLNEAVMFSCLANQLDLLINAAIVFNNYGSQTCLFVSFRILSVSSLWCYFQIQLVDPKIQRFCGLNDISDLHVTNLTYLEEDLQKKPFVSNINQISKQKSCLSSISNKFII